jgi:hypothetical protein
MELKIQDHEDLYQTEMAGYNNYTSAADNFLTYIEIGKDMMTDLELFLERVTNKIVTTNSIVHTMTKLPSLDLPKFSGKCTEWPAFGQLFILELTRNLVFAMLTNSTICDPAWSGGLTGSRRIPSY